MMDSLQIDGMEMPVTTRPAKKKKQKRSFKTQWVKLDRRWAERLQRSKNGQYVPAGHYNSI
jgi:hypothetical protein